MTAIDDETLMAYADGELDAEDARRVSEAVAADPQLAARYRAHQRLRLRMRSAHAAALHEPIPERLLETARSAAGAAVVDLAAHRAARAMPLPPAGTSDGSRRSSGRWASWGGLAASLAIGMVVGALIDVDQPSAAAFENTPDGLAARGAVAEALSTRLAGSDAADAVRLQISFVDRGGNYCRTFSTGAVAGMACRNAGEWMVQQLHQVARQPASEMRQAGAVLPAELLEAVERRMQGQALDSAAERAALARDWQR